MIHFSTLWLPYSHHDIPVVRVLQFTCQVFSCVIACMCEHPFVLTSTPFASKIYKHPFFPSISSSHLYSQMYSNPASSFFLERPGTHLHDTLHLAQAICPSEIHSLYLLPRLLHLVHKDPWEILPCVVQRSGKSLPIVYSTRRQCGLLVPETVECFRTSSSSRKQKSHFF